MKSPYAGKDFEIPKMPPEQACRHRQAMRYLEPTDEVLLEHIAARAVRNDPFLVSGHVMQDLRAVHQVIAPLNLRQLLIAEHEQFMHDIRGVRQWLDRRTLTLGNGFLPHHAIPMEAFV